MAFLTKQAAFTDAAIKRAMQDNKIHQLRDPRYPMYVRFHKNRARASYHWVHYEGNQQTSFKLGTYPTVKPNELLKQLSSIQLQCQQRKPLEHDTQMTLGDVVAWYQKRAVRSSSYSKARRASMQSLIRRHIQPQLADIPVQSLNEPCIDEWLVTLRENYRVSTVKSAFSLLKTMLKQAKRLKFINYNELYIV